MRLWTIQPLAVYEQIQREGYWWFSDAVDEDLPDCPLAYSWLNEEMDKRIGLAPEKAVTPVRGWLRWEPKRILLGGEGD